MGRIIARIFTKGSSRYSYVIDMGYTTEEDLLDEVAYELQQDAFHRDEKTRARAIEGWSRNGKSYISVNTEDISGIIVFDEDEGI